MLKPKVVQKTVAISTLNLPNWLVNYFHTFLIISNLTKHLKINNMRFMTQMMVSDYIKVRGSKRKYLTKDGYFSQQEGFTMIYLLKSKD
jgi:hypothetical protein